MATALVQFSSVEGLLGHLEDEDDDVIHSSLQSLVELIPYHWAEIADELTTIEKLSEDEQFKFSKLASLLASKIFFHIQSYEDSLNHALCAGDLFNVAENSEYVKKLTEQCIDSYRSFQQAEYARTKEAAIDSKTDSDNDSDEDSDADDDLAQSADASAAPAEPMDPRKVNIVEQVFEFCFQTGDFQHAIGIAIECRRLDRVEDAIKLSGDARSEMLMHCFTLCETVLSSRTFRDEMLRLIVRLFGDASTSNYNTICRCYFYLDERKPISDILWTLINSPDDASNTNKRKELTAYQIAFDLNEFQNDAFLRGIFNNIPRPPSSQLDQPKPEPAALPVTAPSDTSAEITSTAMDTDEDERADADVSLWADPLLTKWKRLKSILLGSTMIPKYLDFLYRNSHSDLLILKKIKDGISERNSVLNNSLICCNALMHCGTTIDQFLRDNLEWMARAAHWCKFTATASVGMIHHKHLAESMNILQRYLPGSGGGPYQEGGALYALGLIHVGDSSDLTCGEIRSYLLKHLQSASNEILQHGSCLGLGLAALGYGTQSGAAALGVDGGDDEDDEDDEEVPVVSSEVPEGVGPAAAQILQEIRNVLFQDRAVPGEAAGLSLGLILCGSGNKQWYEEMAAYAHETQHEKIIRGLVMGIAVIFYNLQERAQYAIDALLADKNETIRYGGCYTVGMAFAATGSPKAISLLLHLAVSDVSNDVRRAAVTNIGFVLCNKPASVPKVVQLLANSYNEHVRYGAAAALGISCAGTGNAHALRILKQLAKDKVDYVRQSALISLSMLLMQHNATEQPAVSEIREVFLQGTCVDKREPTMSQMGAILGCGLIDASGRNVTISLFNRHNACKRQSAIIGMAIFWQYWYWYPLIPFITLCLQPTMVMALNHELEMVKMDVESRERNKERFDYVENLKEEKKGKRKKAIKVELSVAAKTKQRQKKKEESKEETTEKEESGEKEEMAVDASESKEEEESGQKEERKYNVLPNPSRVTPNQVQYVQWVDERYRPLTTRFQGFVMVEDTKPEEKVELVEQKQIASGGVYGDEPEPPKPFLYLGN